MEPNRNQMQQEMQQELDIAYMQLGREKVRVELLESTNASLRMQLASLQHRSPTSEDFSRKRKRDETEGDSHTPMIPLQDYQALEQRYQQLIIDHETQVTQLREKLRRAKITWKRWQDYIEKNDARTKAARAGEIVPNPPLASQGTSVAAEGIPVDQTHADHGTSTEVSAHATRLEHRLENMADPPQTEIRRGLDRHSSSQSTQIFSSPPKIASQNVGLDSDSQPAVISARLTENGKRLAKEATTGSVRIKQEDESSQLVSLSSGCDFSPRVDQIMAKEISDLDAPGGIAVDYLEQVPIKREHSQIPRSRMLSEGYERPPRFTATHRATSELPKSHNSAAVSARVLRSEPQHLGLASAIQGDDIAESALKPLSVNIPSPCPRIPIQNRRKRLSTEALRDKITLLSEGGNDPSQPQGEAEDATHLQTISADARQRLENLLDASQVSDTPILHREIQNGQHKRSDGNGLVTPRMQNSETAKRRAHLSTAMATSSTPNKSESRCGQDGELSLNSAGPQQAVRDPKPRGRPDRAAAPLRSLPLDALRLNHFKIDPRFQGTDFAFADPLRGKDQRRCLPGCTRSDCCGPGLRKTFELGGGKRLSGKSDRDALEAYLGPHWEDMMRSFDDVKRDQAINEAHFAVFAAQSGRHRAAFEKVAEPPGFWDTEMPSTQEAKQYRELADQQERQKIEERRREALRGNGRWMFRDE